MGEFALTPKQLEAEEILNGGSRDILLEGGSRSGKTFLIVRKIIERALKAPGSRHGILRFRLKHVVASIVEDTWPKVIRTCWPGLEAPVNRAQLYAQLPGGSQVWFAGLDDKERVEKILGMEFASLFFNECSQIPWASRLVAMTRLAQLVINRATGRPLRLRAYHDCNPPNKGHWTYRLFHLNVDPETRAELGDSGARVRFKINPRDNAVNLSPEYLKTLEDLPARLRKRFLDGEYADTNPNALFSEEALEKWRANGDLPEMLRIVIPVDPSGTGDDEPQDEHDAMGIIPCGLGIDGNGYVLEDLTCNAGPATWGKVATDAFDRLQADCVVGEVNFGGGMVGYVIQTSRPRTPFRKLTASRGKIVRAEPVASMMETGKIRLAGYFPELEDELNGFTTHGYVGDRSPNRADAMIWGMSALFPELTKPEEKPEIKQPTFIRRPGNHSWMRT